MKIKSLNHNLIISNLIFFLCLLIYIFSFFYLNVLNKILLFIIFLLIISFFFKDSIKEDWSTKLFIILLITISLNSPVTDWDAKMIWLMHAKRIFIDKNIYAQLDNYPLESHNDYPILLPLISVSITNFFGNWNTHMANQAVLILLIASVINLSTIITNNINKLLLYSIILFISEKTILSGSVDDILAFIFSISVINICILIFNNKKNAFYFWALLISLTLLNIIKNEGIVLTISILISLVIITKIFDKKINFKIISTILLSSILLIVWKIICYKNNVHNDLITKNAINLLLNNFFNLRNHWTIFNALVLNKSIILPLLLFYSQILIYFINFKKKFKDKTFIFLFFILLISFFYLSFLYLIYLMSPHDLNWHLNTSIHRTVLPIGMLLSISFFFLVKFKK